MKKFALVILAAAILTGLYLRQQVLAPGPLKEKVFVQIPRGAGTAAAAQKLSESGVISSPVLFRLAVRAYRQDKNLKAGEYEFLPHAAMVDVIAKLAAGEVVYRRLTLPEGLTTWQMLEIIANEPLLSGEITLLPKEGELLPETYSFERGDSRDKIIRQAMAAMELVKLRAWENRAANLPYQTPEQMIVMASIIEKETGVPEERGLVASVFVNRLIKGMRLQTDPTVIYALTKGEQVLGRPLYKKDLEIDSPYNTYKYYGLPPAPICNPGKASIEAAVNPEVSNYLYFVADGSGGHNFAASLNEHNKNVSVYRRKN